MTRRTPSPRFVSIAAILLVALLAGPAVGQIIDAPPNDSQSLGYQLFSVKHYISIGAWSLAADYIDGVIARNPDPAEVVKVIETDRDVVGLQNMLKKKIEASPSTPDEQRLQQACIKLDKLIQKGYEISSQPDVIMEAIKQLAMGPRANDAAREKLRKMAPGSIPMMLNVMRNDEDKSLADHVARALPDMGRLAVEPLVAYLDADGEVAVKVIVVKTLASIGYPHAMPAIQRVGEQTDSSQLKAACAAANATLGRSARAQFSGAAAAMYTQLGQAYYGDAPSLRLAPTNSLLPVWMFDKSVGVTSLKVPAPIYNEVMAMRSLERGLLLDANQPQARALWIAANIRKEAQLPAGTKDTSHDPNQPLAHYYAVAHGPSYCLMALDIAVSGGDAAVAFGIAKALAEVGSVASVGQEVDVLTKAMQFPDRAVRYELAVWMADAASKSRTQLPAAQAVVPTLADALGQTGRNYALLLMPAGQDRDKLLGEIRAAGYDATAGATRQEILEKARGTLPHLDLMVLSYDAAEGGLNGLAALRQDYRFRHVPTLLVTNALERAQVAAKDVAYTQVVVPTVLAAEIKSRVDQLLDESARTPMTEALAAEYALRAADALRDIALSNPPGMDFNVAVPALIQSLKDPRLELATAVANDLAFSAEDRSQRALAGAALDAATDPERRVVMFNALGDSARRFGKLVTDEQAKSILDAAMKEADLKVRTAAARAVGALNLSSDQLDALITSQSKLKK